MVAAERVVALRRRQEVARHQVGALVDELVEGVLAVGARLAPDHRPGAVVDRTPGLVDALAVALHVALLQVVGEVTQVLVIGQDGVRPGAEEVAVPDAEQRHDHRDVALERGAAEVLVRAVGAGEQLLEPVHADGNGDRQADCRPQ